MKNAQISIILVLFLTVILTGSCKKVLPSPKVKTQTGVGSGGGGGGGGGGGSTYGNVDFWNDNPAVGLITVYVSSSSGSITSNVTPSSCGTSGCANFSLPAGTYSYSASATTGETWSGNVNFSSGGCLLFNLY